MTNFALMNHKELKISNDIIAEYIKVMEEDLQEATKLLHCEGIQFKPKSKLPSGFNIGEALVSLSKRDRP